MNAVGLALYLPSNDAIKDDQKSIWRFVLRMKPKMK